MKVIVIFILFLFVGHALFAQDDLNTISGAVTFVTSNNVYVRFDSTQHIEIGDRLALNGTDCLQVSEKSSTSVVCTIISGCIVKTGDLVSHNVVVSDESPSEVIEDEVDETIPAEVFLPKTPDTEEPLYKEYIRGRIAAASFNNFSELREDRHRLQTRFSLNANHIDDGKFSIESFLAYRNILSVPENYTARTSIFNVYNLNATYDATPDFSINVGRRINRKASTFGANDGLQVEKYFGNFYAGGVVGFRPDFFDYGFNGDLLQYGGYTGIETESENFYSTTTLGAMEQTNNGATDRRYVFFQHASTISKNLNLFSSLEMDIFGNTGSTSRLTNLYLSARYRFSKAANLMVSYDSRKRIIYYESFQTEIERLLDEDLARQGFRARLNVRPTKKIWVGLSFSNRFQSDNQNKSDNLYGYVTLTKLPAVGGRLNLSYNLNNSRYLSSNILSARHSRELVKGKLQGDFYFRNATYDYTNQAAQYNQNFYGIGLSYRMSRTWQLNFSGELSQFENENNIRVYTQLTKRFYNKKKK